MDLPTIFIVFGIMVLIFTAVLIRDDYPENNYSEGYFLPIQKEHVDGFDPKRIGIDVERNFCDRCNGCITRVGEDECSTTPVDILPEWEIVEVEGLTRVDCKCAHSSSD